MTFCCSNIISNGKCMIKKARFGIIIPSINRASLVMALESCLKQTFADYNVYIIFNGCNHKCIDDYVGKYDERFHFFFSDKEK